MSGQNLLGDPPPVHLPPDPAEAGLAAGMSADLLARRHPASSLAWAALAEAALGAGDELPAYAYARVGYHRGLDALRRAGWRGHGPVPWSHAPNRGFLRALAALAAAADGIGDDAEAARCRELLTECDPSAPGLGG